MGKELVAVKLAATGPTVFAESDDSALAGDESFGRVADPAKTLAQAPKTVEDALDQVVVPAARLFMERMRQLAPDAVDFEFGLKLSGKTGLVFASAEAEAQIKVTLKWNLESN